MKVVKLLNTIYIAFLKGDALSFSKVLKNPASIQQEILLSSIRQNSNTLFGKDHQFSSIKNYEQYTKNVPIREYGDFESYINKIKDGAEKILTNVPVLMFEKTSGSTKNSKYIPYTKKLLREFQNATGAWLYDLYKNNPELKNGRAYWSISPKFGAVEMTAGGLKVGFENDLDYFSKFSQWFMKKVMVIPNNVTRSSIGDFQRITAVALLEAQDLTLISVWSPTFLLELLEYIERNIDNLKKYLSKKSLQRVDQAQLDWNKIWPNLKLVSCWADGAASLFYQQLKFKMPNVAFQGKGLLLTEGVISFPLTGEGSSILALNSHFYEFLTRDNDVVLFNDLKKSEQYIPIITTGGGLYRYKTNDVIEVTGLKNGIPLIKFISRAGNTSDLCGEKLDESQVQSAINKLIDCFKLDPKFVMLAAELDDRRRYILFIEENFENRTEVETKFDEFLRESYHYNLCRELNQLDSVEVCSVKSGNSLYTNELIRRNMVKGLGDIKPAVLSTVTNWKSIMSVG